VKCSAAGGATDANAHNGSHPPRPSSVWADVLPLLSFSAQTLCIAVTNPVLSLVDTSVVGLTSEAQLAAMAPATALSDGLSYALTFIPIAVTNLVALHTARKHPDAAGALRPRPAGIASAAMSA
jgi:Na+-driven multidrug efflux pump